MGQPAVQFGAPAHVGDQLDPEADFGESDRADVEIVERLGSDECHDPALRPRAAQLRKHVRVEQPSRHG
jgi:hypothetical protein